MSFPRWCIANVMATLVKLAASDKERYHKRLLGTGKSGQSRRRGILHGVSDEDIVRKTLGMFARR